jgi:hypothetical protein
VILDDARGRVRQHDLSTVRSCANACRTADSNADIAVGMEMRLGGVQTHSHPYCVKRCQFALSGDGRGDGIGCPLEDSEESVALGIDFVSAMGLQRCAEETTMLCAEVTVRGAMPARELS